MSARDQKDVLILAVDTSCDDTSVAVLKNDTVLSSIVSSQIDIHREWGGVVPNLARREHEKMIDGCIETALKRAGLLRGADTGAGTVADAAVASAGVAGGIAQLDALAVTWGPGLAPALEVGVRTIRELAIEHNKPVVAVNHMEGHTLSCLLKNSKGNYYAGIPSEKAVEFPFLAVVVSGGHTELVWVEDIGTYELLGETLDDAAGEAFDKIARMLDLGYPGGPVISRLAEGGNRTAYPLPRPLSMKPGLDFSFSGLKTAALYNTNALKEELGPEGFAKIIPDYAASVEEAIVDSLVIKAKRVLKDRAPKMVLFGGGVAANNRLRYKFRALCKEYDIPVYFPDKKFCTDNGAMIGLAAYHKFLRGDVVEDVPSLDRDPSIRIDTAI